MSNERWDPMRDVFSLRDALNSLVQEGLSRSGAMAPGGVATLPLDVLETEGEFVLKASLPGAKPDEVQITIHGDTLSIRAELMPEEEGAGQTWLLRERRRGAFQRSLTLSVPVDSDRAVARFDNGVLILTLPKAHEARPKQIKIGQGPR